MGVVYVRPCGPWKRKKLVRRYIHIYIYTLRPAVSSPKHLSVSHWYQEIFHGMTRGQDNGGGRRYRRSRYTHCCRSRRASALRAGGEGREERSEWLLLKSTKRRVYVRVCIRMYEVAPLCRSDRDATFPRLCTTPRVRHVDLKPDSEGRDFRGVFFGRTYPLPCYFLCSLARASFG